jgi:hypothetical protein
MFKKVILGLFSIAYGLTWIICMFLGYYDNNTTITSHGICAGFLIGAGFIFIWDAFDCLKKAKIVDFKI